MSIRRMTSISLFTAIIIVFTVIVPPIPVPIINIPVTLQTLVVMLAGLLLKPVDAFISMLLYVLIGALGFPVFSEYSGGMGVILGPSGGFILSFPIVAFLISYFKQLNTSLHYMIIINVFFGIIITYLLGSIWMNYYINIPFVDLLLSMLIFIPTDIIKIILAILISRKIEHSELYKTKSNEGYLLIK